MKYRAPRHTTALNLHLSVRFSTLHSYDFFFLFFLQKNKMLVLEIEAMTIGLIMGKSNFKTLLNPWTMEKYFKSFLDLVAPEGKLLAEFYFQ